MPKHLEPEELAHLLRERNLSRGDSEELEGVPLPPTWNDVLNESTHNPALYSLYKTGMHMGYRGRDLRMFLILELAKQNARLWKAFIEAQDSGPLLWRLPDVGSKK